MNLQEKWRIWKWLCANNLNGKRNRRAVPKDRHISQILASLTPLQRKSLDEGKNLDSPPLVIPKKKKVPRKDSLASIKYDQGWTKEIRDAFFVSDEWRAIRYQALKLIGGRCCLCGRSAHDGVVLHVDHIKPASKFPELRLELSNLQVLCACCNIGKSNKDDTDWRKPSPPPKAILVKK